ncbi:30S ribosomal protein S2 [Candidatus Babeliales bacterium]|nr:30S ribosomal protein S2 [Candidatus Babeliales bacterium]
MIDFRQLIDVGLHFGHQKSRWCPKMEPYIWGHRGGIHLIDISKTAKALQKASTFLEAVVARGETVLWVGTKKPAKDAIVQVGQATNMPYVDYRWVGGTITNYAQVKKAVTKLLHYDDIVAKSLNENSQYTKKEVVRIQKLAERLQRTFGGLKTLSMPIGAVVVIDVRKEQTALLEAIAAHIPVVALVDTNTDPSGISYVIPGNDDSVKGIAFVLDFLKEGVLRGASQRSETARKVVEDQKAAKELSRTSDGALLDAEEDDADKTSSKKTVVLKKSPKRQHRA